MNILYDIFTITVTGSVVYVIFKGMEQITKYYFSASWHYNVLKGIAVFFLIPLERLLGTIIGCNYFNLDETLYNNLDHKQSLYNFTDGILKACNFSLFQVKIYDWLIVIWISGIIILMLRELICYIRFHSIVMNNKSTSSEYIQNVADLCGMKQSIRQSIHVYINEYVNTPMLTSSFSPIIILPNEKFANNNAEYVLSHELTHYKNKDLMIKLGILFIRTINWFNPIAYLFAENLNMWCEYACDESNTIDLSLEMKKKYGLAILDVAEEMPIYGSNFSTPFLLPKQNLKERLKFMLNVKKMKRHTKIISFAVALLFVMFGFLTAFTAEVRDRNGIVYNNVIKENNSKSQNTYYDSTLSDDFSHKKSMRTEKTEGYSKTE